MQQRQNKDFRSEIYPGGQPDCMIFSTLVSGRLLCGILRRNSSTSSVMAVNPGKLKYLGWDCPSIHLENSHISDEIVFVSIAYTQVYTYKVVVMFYISICRIRYLDWDFPCLHKLWYNFYSFLFSSIFPLLYLK